MVHFWVYHIIHMGIEASNIGIKHVHMFCLLSDGHKLGVRNVSYEFGI